MKRVYFHVATIGDYNRIYTEVLYKMLLHSMLDIGTITVGVVGNGKLISPSGVSEIRLGDVSQCEFPTLGLLQTNAKTYPEDEFLYVHTKGVSTPNNPAIEDWRNYMTYFMVERHEDCHNGLQDHDCVGVDWRTEPAGHYSGNFWWAKGSYIAGLPDIISLGKPDAPRVISVRHNAEFWIGMGNPKALSLWDCGISQYSRHLHCYPREKYANG